jgi:hypothetical protein
MNQRVEATFAGEESQIAGLTPVVVEDAVVLSKPVIF